MEACQCGNRNLEEYSEYYYKCPRCKTLISKYDFSNKIYQIQSEDNDLYGAGYWRSTMLQEAKVKSLEELIDMYIPERVAYWMKVLLEYLHLGEKTIEIGCGLGQLLYVLTCCGFDTMGYELSPEICQYVSKTLDVKMHCGSLESGDVTCSNVVAMDVFEHLVKPDEFLENVRSNLTSDGVLAIQTPCYDPNLSFSEMKRIKPRFEHLLTYKQHVFLYSKDSIRQILKRNGFKDIRFENAYFGNDYDMFVFASTRKLRCNESQEIDAYLNRQQSGRLVKALIKLKNSSVELTEENELLKAQREQMLLDEHKLIDEIHELKRQRERILDDELKLTNEIKVLAELKKSYSSIVEENELLKMQRKQMLLDEHKLIDEIHELKKQREQILADELKLTDEIRRLQG